ncbi:MAG: LysE family translocator [Roseicyclus sp.]
MATTDIAAFIVVASLLVMSPGPNGVLIAKTVPTSGRMAGFANIAGFVTAFFVHGTLSIIGISIILVQSAIAFAALKYVGAAYLCWIGLRALHAAWKGDMVAGPTAPARRQRTLVRAYFEGFLTNALNPKVSMFYLAAFPQFITIGETPMAWAFLLVFVHAMINAVWFTAMILLFAQLTGMTRNVAFQRGLKGLTGIVFVGFGIKLATYRLPV